MYSRLRKFFERQAVVPFETMLAFWFSYAAIVAMAHFGITVSPLAKLIGPKLAIGCYLTYLVAGQALYFGIGLRRADIEGFGLILLITFLIVVTIANSYFFGLTAMAVNSYVLNGAFVFACMIRLRMIWRGQQALNNGTS